MPTPFALASNCDNVTVTMRVPGLSKGACWYLPSGRARGPWETGIALARNLDNIKVPMRVPGLSKGTLVETADGEVLRRNRVLVSATFSNAAHCAAFASYVLICRCVLRTELESVVAGLP